MTVGRTVALQPPRDVRSARVPMALWLLAAVVWLAATAGWRALSLPDEGRYVGVAWEMLRSGDWAVPTLGGLPYFHKPPLFYWITAAALQVGGLHPWTARVASWLAASLAALALFVFLNRWSDAGRARSALLALVTQPLFYGAAQYANLDILVAACIGAAILGFADAALCGAEGRTARASLAIAYAAMALGVLAKGLIGVVLPLLVIGLWTLRQQRGHVRKVWAALWWWPGVALFLLLVVPWFVAMQQRFPGFLDYFFLEQHVRRFASGGFNNVQPFWFYAAVTPLLCLPWTVWLLPALRAAVWNDPEHDLLRSLMLIWAGVVLLFFSWPQSKLVGYVLPACLPLAYLVADGYRSCTSRFTRQAWRVCALVALVAGPLVVGWLARHDGKSSQAFARTLVQTPGAAQQPLVFVDHQPYDLPMLAGRDDALVVIDDWNAPAARARDDWRKELADAARFASAERAARLVSAADIGARLCGSDAAWIVTGKDKAPAWLAGLTPVQTNARARLWRLDGTALQALTRDCPKTPNDAPAGK